MTASYDREALETLAGSRLKGNRAKAAVLIEDVMIALQPIPASLPAQKAAGATPTAAEFDALRADIQTLHRAIYTLQQALARRLLT